MARTILLAPTTLDVGLTSVTLGLTTALENKELKVGFLKAISQSSANLDTSSRLLKNSSVKVGNSISLNDAERLISEDQTDVLLETIVANYQALKKDCDFIIVEGINANRRTSGYANSINFEIAQTLDSEIIFVSSPNSKKLSDIKENAELCASEFGGVDNPNILGLIVNKFNAPLDEKGNIRPDLSDIHQWHENSLEQASDLELIFKKSKIKLLSTIKWQNELIALRALDVCNQLKANVIYEGNLNSTRVSSITFCARSLPNMVDYIKEGALLVTSADRPEVLVTAALATLNGVNLGGILLTGGYKIDAKIHHMCEKAFEKGLPIFRVESNTWQTALNLQNLNFDLPLDDIERIENVKSEVSKQFSPEFINALAQDNARKTALSPASFRYQLTEFAKAAGKTIVLPEGDEPRTIKAAQLCAERGIAKCILLADPKEVAKVAQEQEVTLGEGVEIIDPASIRDNYVARLVELRKAKGMTEELAKEQLQDNVVLGTMMLEANEVDGLVSGAVHTTANTIRPPMQIIKTAPGSSIVSSIFFMLLPDQVLVYGDCAVNPDPSAEQLAQIAIQSADSAKAFGIDPKVAMISYSTGSSGFGADVEKVTKATAIAKELRPDLVIDGPLQYDAAVMADVAASKAPNSPVAGQATVFVFPDLNTGNTTYKAVQRSADLVSIGPMLQGMRKPVNDLSRGALVDDIVYTIALTAIQATQ